MKARKSIDILLSIILIISLSACGSSSYSASRADYGSTKSSYSESNSASELLADIDDGITISEDVSTASSGSGLGFLAGFPTSESESKSSNDFYEYSEEFDAPAEEPASPSKENSVPDKSEVESEHEEASEVSSPIVANNPKLQKDAKLIWTAELEVQTKEYDRLISELNLLLSKYEGYISNSQFVDDDDFVVYDTSRAIGRITYLELRVPSENFQSFINETGDLTAVVTGKNISSYDATREYNDNTERIDLLQAEYDYYKKLLESAEDLETIIELRDTLTDLMSEITSLQTSNKDIAYDAEYSRVYIDITEVIINSSLGLSLKVEETDKSMKLDETFPIKARVVGGEQEIEYWSEDDGIATVSESGLVTAVGSGYTRIHVVAGELDTIVTIYVQPVPPTYSSEAAEAFGRSWDNFKTFWIDLSLAILGSLFQLIVFIVIMAAIVIAFLKIKKRIKDNKKKRELEESNKEYTPMYTNAFPTNQEKPVDNSGK